MKYILPFYLCLLTFGGHGFNNHDTTGITKGCITLHGCNFKSLWLQKTKKEVIRDAREVNSISASVFNSLRFVKIGLNL